jgi:glycosyltransferase involved in cell wall biosynthesis
MTADAVGGVWTYASDLAAGLAERGVDVTIAVLGPCDDHNRYTSPYFRTIMASDVTLDWLAETPEQVLEGGEAVARLATEVDADIVHLNSPALAAGGAFRNPVLGVCHSDVATWWTAVKLGPLPADLAWRAALTGRGYGACNALLAPTAAFAEVTGRIFGLKRTPTPVHNGRKAAETVARAAETPFVFTCGRLWDEGKGAAVLDRAAARIAAPVFAAGPRQGPGTGEIAFAHLVPLGAQPSAEIARWHAAASVFVSTALYEPFGLAVLEAAQAARPLVLSDIPTFRELWDGAALFTPAGDSDALARAVNRLLDDPAERERLGAAAAERAARYTVDAMIERTLAAYRGLQRRKAAA